MNDAVDTRWQILMILMVAAVVTAMAYLLAGRQAEADATPVARAWADTLGIRVTGVACSGSRCTIAPEKGAPFVARCSSSGCVLEVCP